MSARLLYAGTGSKSSGVIMGVALVGSWAWAAGGGSKNRIEASSVVVCVSKKL